MHTRLQDERVTAEEQDVRQHNVRRNRKNEWMHKSRRIWTTQERGNFGSATPFDASRRSSSADFSFVVDYVYSMGHFRPNRQGRKPWIFI